MNDKFLKPYEPAKTEQQIYKLWEKTGFFNPDNLPGKRAESFTVVLPPVNVTGVLHLGHAYEDSLQDAVVRFERMCGKKTLFIPGTDSAAIATQARVEKNIQKEEGKNRHDLGREELVHRITEFAKESETTILNQVRRMGASLDWSRYAYTLDEKRNRAVYEAFRRMYEAGLIYRSNRIVNWDPKGQTTISDDEIVYEERQTKLYTFKYSKDFPIPIATTRPETKVGDTAVAVHPDDERYKEFVGNEYEVTFCDVPIKVRIVADKGVERGFGTGALGVTPAHSMTDWEIAEQHNLPHHQVINEYGKMMVDGRLSGKKTTEARNIVVEWLKEESLLEKEEDIQQNVSTAERTGAVIEPLPKLQWWVNVSKGVLFPTGETMTLKDWMRRAVENGDVDMSQQGFKNVYMNWITNLRDWCISRQIWFGHRIPVWYKNDEIRIMKESPGNEWKQDEDVLDTWFSSALWTFSTLGWPEETNDLKTYHPTSFMSPGYEIINLWVSRMIMMSGFLLGQIPFKTVLIHGLVRAPDGRKFSKSLNNGVDPLDMIDKYGADALRMGLLVGGTIGADIRFDEQRIKAYKHFANKIWNITRFVLENTEGFDADTTLTDADQKLLSEVDGTVKVITKHFSEYRLDLAADVIYHYLWDRFAAEIIEDSKPILSSNNLGAKASRQRTLYEILITSLKLLHPFMPFITEEIWQSLPQRECEMLIITPWPHKT